MVIRYKSVELGSLMKKEEERKGQLENTESRNWNGNGNGKMEKVVSLKLEKVVSAKWLLKHRNWNGKRSPPKQVIINAKNNAKHTH